MNEICVAPNEPWPCGWESHEIAQLRRLAAWPFAEKLAWLEEAEELVRQLQGARHENATFASDAIQHDGERPQR